MLFCWENESQVVCEFVEGSVLGTSDLCAIQLPSVGA